MAKSWGVRRGTSTPLQRMHAYSGEAAAHRGGPVRRGTTEPDASTRYRGSDVIESLEYTSTTNEHTTCTWLAVSCKRTSIDVRLPAPSTAATR